MPKWTQYYRIVNSEAELQAAGENVVFQVGGVTRKLGNFIIYNIIIKYQFDLCAEMMNIAKTERRKFYISSCKIGSRFTDLFSTYFGIGIIPIVFKK